MGSNFSILLFCLVTEGGRFEDFETTWSSVGPFARGILTAE